MNQLPPPLPLDLDAQTPKRGSSRRALAALIAGALLAGVTALVVFVWRPFDLPPPTISFETAVKTGNVNQFERHLKHSHINPNALDADGFSAAHWAAEGGHTEILVSLISMGADINAMSARGVTPLVLAARAGREECVRLLLRRGAFAECAKVVDAIGPIHAAAAGGHLGTVKILLEEGVSPNERTPGGVTPLHAALEGGQEDVIAELVSAGADVNLPDKQGRTPLQMSGGRFDWILLRTTKPETTKPETTKPIIPVRFIRLDLSQNVSMTFVRIDAGEFPQGSDTDLKADRISKDFYIGESEVTQAQWRAVMGTTPWKLLTYTKDGDTYPATFISWDDAQDFMQKVSKATRKRVRLPSEAEWEYACRAGTKTAYSFGASDRDLGDFAWYGDNAFGIGERYAHDVKTKKPNAWGLYDMHGNVWEWCEDRHDAFLRVLRSGSWISTPMSCRSASRGRSRTDGRVFDVGFRVVLDSE